ncbi:MAG TPA: sigma-70 family RNA polymerase sigma factor [Microvirga sp.]|jgi:RNA polymerase sigma-70 factor (ECF subfamily)
MDGTAKPLSAASQAPEGSALGPAGDDPAPLSPDISSALMAAIPHLRAFAISLTGNLDRADDLVQEAILRALANISRFQPGTNLQAWMFTILRNQFHTTYRRRRREVEDVDGRLAGGLSVAPEQQGYLDFQDLRWALAQLPPDQREALLLVGAEGFSYEEAAEICNTKLGTIKSRINRARSRLAEILHVENGQDLGPDSIVQAALAPGGEA